MHKVTAPDATDDNEFTDGDPQSGTPATTVEAKYLNTLQRELVNVVEQENMILDEQDDTQVYQAMRSVVRTMVPGLVEPLINHTVAPGTRMLFVQEAAPPGWTQDNAYNDRVIRVVDSQGVGASVGGDWFISGLMTSAHNHMYSGMTTTESAQRGLVTGSGGQNETVTARLHTHRYAGRTTSSTVPVHSSGLWRPAYLNVIMCRRN